MIKIGIQRMSFRHLRRVRGLKIKAIILRQKYVIDTIQSIYNNILSKKRNYAN